MWHMGGAWCSHRDKAGYDEGEYSFLPDHGALLKSCLELIQAVEELKLKLGCQIMCLVNMDEKVQNGCVGTLVGF